jgi:hypothetical protein
MTDLPIDYRVIKVNCSAIKMEAQPKVPAALATISDTYTVFWLVEKFLQDRSDDVAQQMDATRYEREDLKNELFRRPHIPHGPGYVLGKSRAYDLLEDLQDDTCAYVQMMCRMEELQRLHISQWKIEYLNDLWDEWFEQTMPSVLTKAKGLLRLHKLK